MIILPNQKQKKYKQDICLRKQERSARKFVLFARNKTETNKWLFISLD